MPLMSSTLSSFADYAVWEVISQFFFIGLFLFVGWFLSRMPFIRRSLIPASLLGGLVVLLLKLIPFFDDLIDYNTMEMITYHCLGLGFIGMALKKNNENKNKKSNVKAVLNSGLLIGGTYVIQGIIGIAITICLFYATNKNFFPAGGLLLPLGYGQGSGQALNYGIQFQEAGMTGGSTFGLSIATVGFLVAAFVGVVFMNILRKKGKIKQAKETEIDTYDASEIYSPNEAPSTPSIDKLTICLFFITIVYAAVYLLMKTVNVGLIWGFNFLLGTIFASILRFIMNFLEKEHKTKKGKVFKSWIKKEPLNNYCLNRCSNFFFDVMIIAGCCAIDLSELSAQWWQLVIICVLGAVGTFFYVFFISKEIYKGYEYEGFFSMFGMLTGTASSGMILLRELDQKYETPAAQNLVLGGIPAIAFGGVLLILLSYAPKGITQSFVSLAILVAAGIIITLILFRSRIFKKKNKEEPNPETTKE